MFCMRLWGAGGLRLGITACLTRSGMQINEPAKRRVGSNGELVLLPEEIREHTDMAYELTEGLFEALREFGLTETGDKFVQGRGKHLSIRDWIFVKAYTAYGEETFGSSIKSYRLAFPDRAAKSKNVDNLAHKVKSRKGIQKAIEERLKMIGLNDNDVDLEHMKVIKQDKDLSNKMKGIVEYNKLRGRGIQERDTVVVNVVNYECREKGDKFAAKVGSKD